MTTIFVTDAAGRETELSVRDGELLMHVLRSADLGIKGSCEASLSCGSCHVFIDAQSVDKLPAPSAEEAEMIEFTDGASPTSRFSCQIRVGAGLDGLRLSLPA